jgi:hypothetical protein
LLRAADLVLTVFEPLDLTGPIPPYLNFQRRSGGIV